VPKLPIRFHDEPAIKKMPSTAKYGSINSRGAPFDPNKSQATDMTEVTRPEKYRAALRILSALLLLAFMAAFGLVLRPFVTPLLWSIILATSTWPTFARLRRTIPAPPYLAPLCATLLLGIVLLLIIVPLPLQLAAEVAELRTHLLALDIATVQHSLAAIPFIGPILANMADTVIREPIDVNSLLSEHQREFLSFATAAARGVLTTIVVTIATLIGCYFLFRYGETLLNQFRRILERIGGESIPKLLDTVNVTVRGAAYSVLATAVAQGILAGIGYLVTGAPVPLLLAMVTMIFSLIPFGTPFVYLPVSAYLLFFSGLPWYHGVGLGLWGALVVSTVDNLLRPLFISQSTKVSPILVFIGVLGGIAAFGLIGVFIGPALMAVAHWLWLDFSRAEDGLI
jgi:predicted PurR-regulated permease PerM